MFANEPAGFNRPVAEIIFKAIMGLDADEAVVFSTMLVAETIASDLMVHGGTVGRVMKRDAAQRTELLKRDLARTAVAKARRGDDSTPELQALVALQKALQLPGGISIGFGGGRTGDGNEHAARVRRATDQLRDLQSGQFIQEHIDIDHTNTQGPTDAMAAKHGIPPARFEGLSSAQRAQFFNSYAQTGALIEPYQRLPKGQAYAHLIRANGPAGGQLVDIAPGQRLDPGLFSPNHEHGPVVAAKVSKVPDTDAPGATFDVFRAFGANGAASAHAAGQLNGGILDPSTIRAFGQATQGQASDEFVPSQKLFRRLTAGSQLLTATLGTAAPPQAKMALAVAHHIGTYGPEAQKVIGPIADRAAYRYRGTERKPDAPLVRAFEQANVLANNNPRLVETKKAVEAAITTRDRQMGQNRVSFSERQGETLRIVQRANDKRRAGAITKEQHKAILRQAKIEDAAARKQLSVGDAKAKTDFEAAHGSATAAQKLAQSETGRAAANIAAEGYTNKQGEWRAGPVIDYFQRQLPSAELNDLQLKSGVTPPSEGVIINSKGRLAHQVVGYGDDHYLPFNLKNLRSLRGGEYVRTRTFGGPTTEDIYTGLIAGAKRLTVVSRSGVYTVTFDPTFHGGRRYNDKAARMVGRYAHLLDALGSGNVGSEPIDPSMMTQMREQAAQLSGGDPARSAELLNALKAQQLSNPQLSQRQKDEAATEWLGTASVVNTHGETMTPEQAVHEAATKQAGHEHTVLLERYRADVTAHHADLRAYNDNAANRARWIVDHPGSEMGWNEPVAPSPPPSVEVLAQGLVSQLGSLGPTEYAQKVAELTSSTASYTRFLRGKENEAREATLKLSLNGPGYYKALQALSEQFPYYFRPPQYHPNEHSAKTDTGYVKPKYLRPTQAVAGFYGHGTNRPAETAKTPAATQAQGIAAPATAPPASGAPSGQSAAPAVDQVAADRALMEHLLALGDTPVGPNEIGVEGPLRKAIAASPPNAVPPELQFLFGNSARAADPVEVRRTFESNPRAAAKYVHDAADFLETNNLFTLDQNLVGAAKGVSTVKFDSNDLAGMLAKPNANYELGTAHGPEYMPSKTVTPDQVQAAYGRNREIQRVVAAGMLPAEVGATDFRDISTLAHRSLADQNEAYDAWFATSGGMGQAPADRELLGRDVGALVQANQLNRRYTEATANATAAQAAATPNVTAVFAPDMSQWSLEDIQRFGAMNEEQKAATLNEMRRLASTNTGGAVGTAGTTDTVHRFG